MCKETIPYPKCLSRKEWAEGYAADQDAINTLV